MDNQQPWSPAHGGTEEDFNFLDFNDVDLTFSNGDGIGDGNTAIQEQMDITHHAFSPDLDTSQISTPVSTAYPSADSLADMALQQQMFQQSLHHHQSQQPSTNMRHAILRNQPGVQNHYYGQGMVPPTPDTVEMQGAQVHAFTDSQALGMYETSKAHDQMVFTPLVSPAFQLQEHSTPSEYFSPLTSPAIQAQDFTRHPNSTHQGGDVERKDTMGSASMGRKPKRRTPASKDPVRAVRSSPAMKAQQKRYSSSAKTPREVAEVIAGLGSLQQDGQVLSANGKASVLQSQNNSETGSISPEPLSEVLMPPPAAPRSSTQGTSAQSSPRTLQGKTSNGQTPATPASLFRIPRSDDGHGLDNARSQIQHSKQANTAVGRRFAPSAPTTPGLIAQDTSMGNTTPTSTIGRSISSAPASAATASPNTGDIGSPAVSLSSQSLKDPAPAGRGMKKRSSSSHVSPALRPRISPSIKPLLPGGANLDSETTALLLANKSNYERIIDGSASQLGVTFPAQLSENLTSKRTSHKLAEQGRRNRINTALQEIQTLIPEGIGKESVEPSGGGSNASKAKTVENAISYIKMLQSELSTTRSALELAQQRLGESSTSRRGSTSGDSAPHLTDDTAGS